MKKDDFLNFIKKIPEDTNFYVFGVDTYNIPPDMNLDAIVKFARTVELADIKTS